MIQMPAITWTRFQDRAALVSRELRQEWRELLEHIQDAGPYPSKQDCPWVKLARFGTQRSRGNSLRNNRNVLDVSGVEGDYDAGLIQPEEAIEMLEKAGIRAAVYTSPSHTPQKPRWRVLAPFARPLPAYERSVMLARVNGALGGILTSESFTLSQSYYYGRVQDQTDYRVLVTFDDADDGHCVDDLANLDHIAVGSPINGAAADDDMPPVHAIAATVEQLGRRLRTGDGRRNLLRSYIGDRSVRGLSADEIGVLVKDMAARFFDPADPLNWDNVSEIIAGFAAEDASRRQSIQDTVGEFVTGLATKSTQRGTVPILDMSQLRQSCESISWVVKHVIPADSIGILFGASGTFKSFVALDMALHVAHGLPWLGKKTKKSPVLFIAAEGGAGLWRRIQAWHQSRGLAADGIEFFVVPVAVALTRNAAKVVEAAHAAGVQPAVVVVDTLSQTFDGEENSANEIAAYLRALGDQFRASWRCAVLVIHHSGHSATERPRGSSALRANVDFMFGVFRDEHELLATVENVKQKDGELHDSITFTMHTERVGVDEDGEPISSLVARSTNGTDDLLGAMRTSIESGRGGRNAKLYELAANGMSEKELRREFYEAIGLDDAEARKKAYQRAREWTIKQRLLGFSGGLVTVLAGQP